MKRRLATLVCCVVACASIAQAASLEPKPNPSWLMLQSTEKPTQEYPTLKVWGLVDAVYSHDDTDLLVPDNSASLRRGYVGIRGSWMENIDYFVLADFGTGVAGRTSPLLLDASVSLKHVPYLKARFGQFKVPFGLEGLEGHMTPPLINFTRAAVQLMSFSAPLGLSTSTRVASNSAFRDIGAQVFDEVGSADKIQLVYALAVFNGNGINTTDNNNDKDLSGRLEIASRGFRLGLSGLTGRETADKLRKNRLGTDATYNLGPLHMGGEWIWGQDRLLAGGHRTAWGWHLRASYLLTSALQPVLRYEEFDPNDVTSGDRYQATAVGLNWIFKGYTRLQLNYEFRKDQANALLGNLLTGQVQVLF